jgi:hypothetical protein
LIHQVLFEQFVGSFSAPPKELILDFDCTDDRVHGMQIEKIGADLFGRIQELASLAFVVFRQFDICFPTTAKPIQPKARRDTSRSV